MARRDRWVVFADDAGDPGAAGTSHFGYAMVALRRESFPAFTHARASFRHRERVFGESKSGNVESEHFRRAIDVVSELTKVGEMLVSVSMVDKSHYSGAWLHPVDGKPASATYLRNYVVRKNLEFLFDGMELDRCSADLVLDRVDYSDDQIANLRRYLGGEFNGQGHFRYPRITHITHADSIYLEGLQVADHVARLAYRLSSRGLADSHYAGRFLRVQTILGRRSLGRET